MMEHKSDSEHLYCGDVLTFTAGNVGCVIPLGVAVLWGPL